MASPISKTSIADQVFQYLREGILENRLAGGERLKEREIAERLSVSRTPVREALRMLEAEGLVVRNTSGYGVVVERSIEDMLEAFHVRIALECYAVRLAATTASEAQLKQLETITSEMASQLDEGTANSDSQQGAAFHEAIVSLTGNSRITKLLDEIIDYIDLYRQRLFRLPNFNEQNLVTHHQILEAIRARDEDRAAALMREHLRTSMELIRTLWEDDHRT